MSERLIIKLPFPGFYHSLYSEEVDHNERQEIERLTEAEAQQPQELQITEDEFAEILMRVTEYGDCYREIAREYVAAFNDHFSEQFGRPLQLEYESMDSPREYNFTTDRVYAYVPVDVVQWLLARSAADDHETLRGVLRQRFTSRDGFLSYYRNDVESWLAKPLADWDHNELESLLLANMRLLAIDNGDGDDDWRWPIFYSLAEEVICLAYQEAVDWQKFEAQVAELRADKLADWQAEHPDLIPPEPPYRCPDTPDMFRDLRGRE